MDIQLLLDALGYSSSQSNWFTVENAPSGLVQHLHLARKANVIGCYVYHTSEGDRLTPPQPAVYVAEAKNAEEARRIQKQLFCLGNCPFLVIILPGSIQAYSCFCYDAHDSDVGLISTQTTETFVSLSEEMQPFEASEIDSGRIWERLADYLSSETRVDFHLLKNLRDLSGVLRNTYAVTRETAHALIGKYIYFHYLRDRGILDTEWMQQHNVQLAGVFGRDADADSFLALSDALQARFNGDIFPLPADAAQGWKNNGALPFLARIFEGDEAVLSGSELVIQLALDFQAYDFSFIPIELLSSIYEQFLNDKERSDNGVVYTPEPLADYVLAELQSVHTLQPNARILDPCCGSGVFLVLAYRRLIELARQQQDRRPTPEELSLILTQSIFGVEKDREACYITAFSLLLTLLSQLDADELQNSDGFQFPTLVGRNIFEADFFDDACPVFTQGMRFDWIAGNPPWTTAKESEQTPASIWISHAGKSGRPLKGRRVDEAFTWRAGDLLSGDGCAGLLIKATTLVNPESAEYRTTFFAQQYVRRVTNFSNLRYMLFMGAEKARAKAPAACLVYTKYSGTQHREPVLHFGPFVANQVATRRGAQRSGRRRVWSITIYDSDIQAIDYRDAVDDATCLWKTALWGTYIDKRVLTQTLRVLPIKLGQLIDDSKWLLSKGLPIKTKRGTANGKYTTSTALKDKSEINLDTINDLGVHFFVPDRAITKIEEERQQISVRGGAKGLGLTPAPHILINATRFLFSDRDFVIPDPQLGISGSHEYTERLKALALYLNSSIARYQLFFRSAHWGVTISKINPEEIRQLPFPDLTAEQTVRLAALYDGFAERERATLEQSAPLHTHLLDVQDELDDAVETELNIPKHISMIARDFMRVPYQLLEGKTGETARKLPSEDQLTAYAEQLRLQVDDFARRKHRVSIRYGQDAILATVELTREPETVPVTVIRQETAARDLLKATGEQHSQWVYVQRSVRIFNGPRVHIIKSARLLDWTRTQAILDAGDLIAEVLDKTSPHA